MGSEAINSYVILIEKFVKNEISVDVFEQSFLNMFKSQEEFLPEDVFHILDGLFGDVDAFCVDPTIRGDEDLNEHQLRDRCAAALESLKSAL